MAHLGQFYSNSFLFVNCVPTYFITREPIPQPGNKGRHAGPDSVSRVCFVWQRLSDLDSVALGQDLEFPCKGAPSPVGSEALNSSCERRGC